MTTEIPAEIEETIELRAKDFQHEVYMADPDMVDSNPAKLFIYGARFGYELAMKELARLQSTANGFADGMIAAAQDIAALDAENAALKWALAKIAKSSCCNVCECLAYVATEALRANKPKDEG